MYRYERVQRRRETGGEKILRESREQREREREERERERETERREKGTEGM